MISDYSIFSYPIWNVYTLLRHTSVKPECFLLSNLEFKFIEDGSRNSYRIHIHNASSSIPFLYINKTFHFISRKDIHVIPICACTRLIIPRYQHRCMCAICMTQTDNLNSFIHIIRFHLSCIQFYQESYLRICL